MDPADRRRTVDSAGPPPLAGARDQRPLPPLTATKDSASDWRPTHVPTGAGGSTNGSPRFRGFLR
jgi:hypothetical protein